MLDQILRWLPNLSVDELNKLDLAIELELARRDICEHGMDTQHFCPECRDEYRRARVEHYGTAD